MDDKRILLRKLAVAIGIKRSYNYKDLEEEIFDWIADAKEALERDKIGRDVARKILSEPLRHADDRD